MVVEALAAHGGNQTHAAKTLGLSRFGLQKKLRRLGISARGGAAGEQAEAAVRPSRRPAGSAR